MLSQIYDQTDLQDQIISLLNDWPGQLLWATLAIGFLTMTIIACYKSVIRIPFNYDRYGHLYPVRLNGKKFYGLHSTKDEILNRAFRLGQTAAGEGFSPTAVGIKGNPKSIWTAGEEATELTHGEYWQSERNSSLISEKIGQPSTRLLATRKIAKRKQTFYWLNEFGER